ncbi:hypothetical protein SCHPADRAFT_911871 [Schizopora paradoxa]|uniref:Uncharacterized protein n=1 Tax=Schizopora paradoxa TaxID=27342 RepID=A0A0H2RGP5_9AGAM|nr:hypothetical protein SCHPADRAFT_911871 [Schizopora paradoxa]
MKLIATIHTIALSALGDLFSNKVIQAFTDGLHRLYVVHDGKTTAPLKWYIQVSGNSELRTSESAKHDSDVLRHDNDTSGAVRERD